MKLMTIRALDGLQQTTASNSASKPNPLLIIGLGLLIIAPLALEIFTDSRA